MKAENILLTHWTRLDKPYFESSPNMHGAGILGAESKRKCDFPSAWVNRTYCGFGKYQREGRLGECRYVTQVDKSKLYDFQENPDNLWPTDSEIEDLCGWPNDKNAAFTLYERKIEEAGYVGYFHKTLNVAALFVSVKWVRVRDSEGCVQTNFKALTTANLREKAHKATLECDWPSALALYELALEYHPFRDNPTGMCVKDIENLETNINCLKALCES